MMNLVFVRAYTVVVLLLFSFVAAATEVSPGNEAAIVTSDKTFVFEEPNERANVVRMIYVGELVQVIGEVNSNNGRKWAKIALGNKATGFVVLEKLQLGRKYDLEEYTPSRVIRDERPLSLGLKIEGETRGAAINLRYQPFSRLGFSFAAGSLLDKGKMAGTSLSGSVLVIPTLWNLSPVLELGFDRLSYHATKTLLRVFSFHMSISLEYITSIGVFIGAGVTYLRSADIEISTQYADAKHNNIAAEHYGSLDPGDKSLLQDLRPLFHIGYAF